MSIINIMTKRVVSVHMDDSLAMVQDIFNQSQFHHLLVVEDKKLVGIISDRDLFKAVSPFIDTIAERMKDRATLDKRVHQVMSRDLIVLPENASMVQAITKFNDNNISCLPVINSKDEPVGIISWRDIFRYITASVERKKQE